VTLLVSKNVICWFIDCNSVMSCVEGNTKVIYKSSSFIRHSLITFTHNFITVCYTVVCTVIINDCFQAVDPHHYWNRQWMHLLPFLPSNLICYSIMWTDIQVHQDWYWMKLSLFCNSKTDASSKPSLSVTVLCKTHTHFTILSAIFGDVSIGLFNILHLPASIPKALSSTLLPLLRW
jgi:hypothetical protein